MTHSPSKTETRDLDVVQQWFHAVITHPDGVAQGIESSKAQQNIVLNRDELEKVVTRSNKLGAADRLSVYANAYYARLIECLGECFPVLKKAVGEDVFNGFAFGYLQEFPSRSYTLNHIGDDFADYLDRTRPDRANEPGPEGIEEETESQDDRPAANWPDFLIDLARLEWAIGQVFDGPGIETLDILTPDKLKQMAPESWPDAKLIPAPSLVLMTFRYPVNACFTAVMNADEGEEVELPHEPEELYLALHRQHYIVRRYELNKPQFLLLESLLAGNTVGQSIEHAAQAVEADDDHFASALHQWFQLWASHGFFLSAQT
jgi:hypothetical protein